MPKVFAHYMVTYLPYGSTNKTISVAAYEQEIAYAQSLGIDGWALNCGGWTGGAAYYKTRSQMIYQAAENLGTGFLLVMSADFTTLDPANVTDMVQTFYAHPNQWRIGGMPVLSTYTGDTEYGAVAPILTALASGGRPVYFFPNFHIAEDANGLIYNAQMTALFATYPLMNGEFLFGAAALPASINNKTDVGMAVCPGIPASYMAGISPYYRAKTATNHRLFPTQGFQGMQSEWAECIAQSADYVEITTWNDVSEDTYVSGTVTTNPFPDILPHGAWLTASAYYISWYKNGTPPAITVDLLCYFYRLYPKALQTTQIPAMLSSEADDVYVTAFLTAPATLTINSGGTSQSFPLSSGVNNVSMPFAAGTQEFILTRNGKVVIDKVGELSIGVNTISNLNYFAGSSVSPPLPVGRSARQCRPLSQPRSQLDEQISAGALTLTVTLPFDQVQQWATQLPNVSGAPDTLVVNYTDYLGQPGSFVRTMTFWMSDGGYAVISADQATQLLIPSVNGPFFDANATVVNARNVAVGALQLLPCGNTSQYGYLALVTGETLPTVFIQGGTLQPAGAA